MRREPWREDLITGLLSTTLVAGLFLDGWNHINLQNGALGSFFTGWHAPAWYPRESSFRRLFPTLLSLTLATAVAAFMFQWLSAFLDWTPSLPLGRMPSSLQADVRVRYTAEFTAVARVLATNIILLAPLFLALRRWQLPFGSATFLMVVVSAAMSGLTSFDLGWTIVAAAIGGLVFDLIVAVTRPDTAHTFGY